MSWMSGRRSSTRNDRTKPWTVSARPMSTSPQRRSTTPRSKTLSTRGGIRPGRSTTAAAGASEESAPSLAIHLRDTRWESS
jgi:hypothetical protein